VFSAKTKHAYHLYGTIKSSIFCIKNVKYTRDKTQDKTHSPRILQNVSNATTHITHKHLNNLYTTVK